MKYVLIILTLISLSATAQNCYDIPLSKFKKNTSLIDNGNTTICEGNTIGISVTGLGQKYCSNFNLPASGIITFTPHNTVNDTVWSIKESGNLVVNGNFNLGNTGFQSDYSLDTYGVYVEGFYFVGTDPTKVHPTARNCTDHTTGSGNMLLVNGSLRPNQRVWYAKFAVIQGNDYTFEFWANNIHNDPSGKLKVTFDGVTVDTAQWISGHCEWQKYSVTWHNTNKDSVTVAIVDDNLASGDNDFAIDDISFSTTSYEYDNVTIEVIKGAKTITDTVRTCDIHAVSGVYIDTLRNGSCDTLYKVHVVQVTTTIPVTKVCPYYGCNSYTLNGITYTKSTTTHDTLKTNSGCDSLYLVNEIVIGKIPVTISIDTIKHCGFFTYEGILYVEPTLLTIDTVRTSQGCDSLIHQKQILISPPAQTFSNTIFSCEPVKYRGILYSSSTVLKDTLRGRFGCDSLYSTVEIIVGQPAKQIVDTIYTCNETKITKDTARTVLGCDSLIHTTYFIAKVNVRSDTIDKTICQGALFISPSGITLSQQGTYRDTIRYTSGCDSLITLIHLKVNIVHFYINHIELCPGGYAILPTGDTIRKSINDTIRYANGCDSLIRHIEVTPMTVKNEDVTLALPCQKSIQLPTGETVDQPGTYTHIIHSRFGCDSVIKIFHVSFKIPSGTISKSNDVNCRLGYSKLKVSGGRKYEWKGDNIDNPNASSVVVTPTHSTIYKVNVTTNDGCTYTDSVLVKVNKNDAGNIDVPDAFTPNNDGKNDCWSASNLGAVSNFKLSIFNRWGNEVFTTTNVTDCWDGKLKGIEQKTDTYVYSMHGESACGVINKKGTIILIR